MEFLPYFQQMIMTGPPPVNQRAVNQRGVPPMPTPDMPDMPDMELNTADDWEQEWEEFLRSRADLNSNRAVQRIIHFVQRLRDIRDSSVRIRKISEIRQILNYYSGVDSGVDMQLLREAFDALERFEHD